MKRFHDRLTCFLEVLICLCFLSFFTMVILLVGLRYLFDYSIIGVNEIINILFVYTTAIGAAIAVGQRGHIAINILSDNLPEHLAKRLSKPCLVLSKTDGDLLILAKALRQFIAVNNIAVLNVAGPRESGESGVGEFTAGLLDAAFGQAGGPEN